MMAPTLERSKRPGPPKSIARCGEYIADAASVNDAKQMFTYTRDCSKRDRIQSNFPRTVLSDIETANAPGVRSQAFRVSYKDATHSKGIEVTLFHDPLTNKVRVYVIADEPKDFAGKLIFPLWRVATRNKRLSQRHESEVALEFVARFHALEASGRRDEALDELYDRIDDKLRAGRFSEVDQFLWMLPVDKLSLHLLIGVLTATLPGKSKLSSRTLFRQQAENVLRKRGEYRESLLAGL